MHRNTVIALILMGLFLLSGYMFLTFRSLDLDFVDVKFPAGFRELRTNSGSVPTTHPLTIGLNDRASNGATATINPGKVCETLFEDTSSPRVGKDNATVR